MKIKKNDRDKISEKVFFFFFLIVYGIWLDLVIPSFQNLGNPILFNLAAASVLAFHQETKNNIHIKCSRIERLE